MRALIFGIAILSIAVACGCSNATDKAAANSNAGKRPANESPVPAYQPNEAPRIALADAKKDFDAGTAVFIDTHTAEFYAKQHIPGAINISVSELAAKEDKIPKGKKIIAYCS